MPTARATEGNRHTTGLSRTQPHKDTAEPAKNSKRADNLNKNSARTTKAPMKGNTRWERIDVGDGSGEAGQRPSPADKNWQEKRHVAEHSHAAKDKEAGEACKHQSVGEFVDACASGAAAFVTTRVSEAVADMYMRQQRMQEWITQRVLVAARQVRATVALMLWCIIAACRSVATRSAHATLGSLSGVRHLVGWCIEFARDVWDVLQQIGRHWVSNSLGRTLRSSHRTALRAQLEHARDYDEWREAAQQLDRIGGNLTWKMGFESTLYDYMLLRDHLDAFYRARKRDDRRRMAWLLRTTLQRNLAGMGNPRLFEKCYDGTKDLIEQYVDEVVYQINYLTDTNVPGMSHEDKVQMFEALRSAFGCSALLLSGGGGFGIYHLGVVRVLHQQGLLPRIVSGSSAGSLMASLICTRTDDELDHFFAQEVPDVKNWCV